MLKSKERQTIQECIDATRLHERYLADVLQCWKDKRGRDSLPAFEDIIEGLAVTATKLEVLLNV